VAGSSSQVAMMTFLIFSVIVVVGIQDASRTRPGRAMLIIFRNINAMLTVHD
jgi:hypothetical protein